MVAVSLFAITLFCAFGVLAANPDVVYQTTFNPNTPILGDVKIRLQNDSINPLMIFALNPSGIKKPLSFEVSHREISISSNPFPNGISQILVVYRARLHNDSLNRARVYTNNNPAPGGWTEPSILIDVGLTDIYDSLSIGFVGAIDTHTVIFTTNTFPIADSGAVWVNFPDGFNIVDVGSVIYSDNDTTNDAPNVRPIIESISKIGSSVVFRFAPGRKQAVSYSQIRLKFWTVKNDTIAQERSVLVMTTNSNGEIENDLASSVPFTLFPGPVTHIAIKPDTAMTLQAGSLVNFQTTGYDRYNNILSNIIFTYDVTVDSCGDIVDGAFRAHKLGQTYVTASASSLIDSSGLLTITPGPLGRFEASGYPASVTAGSPFQNAIVVTAFDTEGNRKTNYLGDLWFGTGDTLADLPYRVSNPFHFQAGDAGQVSFPGSGFVLRTVGTGISTIQATNGTIGVISPQIRVLAATINHFTLFTGPSHVAGEGFLVTVSNARDVFGNLAAGTIIISDSVGAGNSPNGTTPTFSSVTVSSGTGSALQTLVRAGSGIILKGVYTASVRAATDPFTVLPGAFGSFTLAGYPDTVGAGSTFIPPVRVHVSDIYGNAKSNYIGQVYFESSDPLAVLPYTSSSPCNFVGSDSAFAGSRFSLRTSGRQTITVTDGVFSATSNIITVTPAAITAFSLSAPGSAVAGTPFSASVSGAHDVWGNAANGTIGISAQSGGGPSPNGTQPSYSPITVINGSGSALQTLFNVNSTVLRGVTDTVVSLTAPIAVAPGTLGGFTMNGFPDTTYAGVPFTSPINVHVSDIFGNAKTNYNGLVYFTSTDPAAILPYTSGSRCNFVGSDSSFAGDRFSLRTAGRKTITITDGALSTPSNIITVKPAPITAFNLSAPQNAVAGTPFSAIVSGAFDVWGNPANGTVTISALSGGGSSPNGTQPIYSPITVVEGSGSALQTLFNVNTTVLRGMANSVVSMTGPIAVAPGPLGGFITSGFPDTADAGTPFESPVNVHVSDIFGNAKTNYNGTVYFTSTDPLAILPYTFSAPCNFVGSDSSFAGTRFTLRTVGRHTISVTDGAFSTPSNFITVRSTPIIEFELSAPFNTTAGVPFSVNVSNARDAWGNAANGVVTIATASGGGPSPNGTQPAFSPITVINGAGTANQTLFNAVTTVLQGTTGIVVVQTAPISVAPGTLGGFTLTGCPDTVGAGTTFIPSVAVHVLDIFGNAKSNYSGLVYFESSDPLAVLPYTSSSPCNFVGSDSVFAGSRFSLRTAGRQTITVTDSVFSATSNIIAVTPAAITAFSLTAPNNVVAGTPFLASVTGAQDAWGNAANGTVGISAQSGGGPSPNGTQPSYSSITVVNGSGNAQQTLFNVNSTVLKGVIESVEAFTDPIAVAPGLLGGFNFVVSSPQVTGVPFRNLATLTTLDRYGNLKTDFDASTDSVVITSTSGGQLSNNIFRSQTDFNQGVADLVAKGTTYRGLGGLMSFQAASRSNVSGLSNQVDMNAIRCVNFNIDQSSAAQGDTITGSISVNNVAGRNVTITGLSVIDDLNWLPQIAPDSALPVTIDPGVTRVFSFTLPIPEDLIIGFHRLTAAAFGAFGIDNVADTLSGFPDSIRVQPRSTLSYVVGTINPDTLSSGLYYSLSFRMINTGTSALALYDSSYLTFTDNTTFFRADLAAPAYLTPNNPVLLTLESALVPLAFIPGSYTPTFHYFGNENGNFRSGQVNLADPILVQSGSVLSYAGNLNIDSLVGGQNAAFSIVIQNNGQADFIVRHQATRLSFNDSQREYIAYSDT
ncbi:MAG TPA: hypothetical protein DCZ43_01455, partial [candidate division Zixibacteria bacterium]|nr:hypothetical protein [candidate division Zixibacteria bacterium]